MVVSDVPAEGGCVAMQARVQVDDQEFEFIPRPTHGLAHVRPSLHVSESQSLKVVWTTHLGVGALDKGRMAGSVLKLEVADERSGGEGRVALLCRWRSAQVDHKVACVRAKVQVRTHDTTHGTHGAHQTRHTTHGTL